MKWKYNTRNFLRHSKSSAGGKLQHKLVLKILILHHWHWYLRNLKKKGGGNTQREKEGTNKEQKAMEMTEPVSSRNKAEDITSEPLDTRRISKKCVKDGAHLTVLTEEMSWFLRKQRCCKAPPWNLADSITGWICIGL